MSFSELYQQQDVTRKKYLKTDWSEEEKAFKLFIPEFQKSIECANPKVACIQLKEEDLAQEIKKKEDKKSDSQPSAVIEVAKKVEEKSENNVLTTRDVASNSVQSCHAEGSKEDSSSSKPTAKAGNKVDEDFDMLFSSPDEKKPETPIVQASVIKPAAKVTEDPFSEKTTAENWKVETASSDQLKTETEETDKTTPGSVNNEDELARIQAIVDAMLGEVVSPSKIASLWKDSQGYVHHLELDHYRRSPDILPNQMVKVQNMRDSILSPLIEISDWMTKFEDAEKYFLEVAAEYVSDKSQKSSQKSRESACRLRFSEYVKMHLEIKRLYNVYDRLHKSLCSQYECVSRMMTATLTEYKGGGPGHSSPAYQTPVHAPVAPKIEVDSDAPPFDGPYKTVATPVKESHSAKSEPKAQVPPSNKTTKGLDAFEAPKEQDKKVTTTGFVGSSDFEF